MQGNVVQRTKMKLKYKLFLAFTILFTVLTIVLGIINNIIHGNNKILEGIVLLFSFIAIILNIIMMMFCIDYKSLYDYETLTITQSASI